MLTQKSNFIIRFAPLCDLIFCSQMYRFMCGENRWFGLCEVGVNKQTSPLNSTVCLNQVLSNCFCLQMLEVRGTYSP